MPNKCIELESVKSLVNKLLENENRKWRCIFLTILLLGGLSYYLILITGLTCPDGICEGLTFYNYTSEDWASRNGRWAIRYLNKLSGNIVIPMFTIVAYCICIGFVVYLLTDCFNIQKRISIISITAIMITSPCMIAHFLYTYMALAYGCSCLLATIFVWILYTQKRKWKYILACISLSVSLGLYQSYVGLAVLLVLLLLITEAIKGVFWKEIGRQALEYSLCGLSGCLLYLVIVKLDLKFRHLPPASRVSSFDPKTILELIPESAGAAYEKWKIYFEDDMFCRNIFYYFVFIVLIVLAGTALAALVRRHKYVNIVMILGLMPLIPVAANFVGIVIPTFEVYLLMQYQYVLIIPFAVKLVEMVDLRNRLLHFIKMGIYAAICIIAWTYMISANATYSCYKLSYNHINFETSLVLADVYKLPGYDSSKSKIIFAGFPGAEVLHENINTYKYAIYYVGNPVFWLDMHGANGNRYWYLLNYFGIDGGYFTNEEYVNIIHSEEFQKMSIWPEDNSIKMIQGNAVVKFTDTPPEP